MSLHFFFGKSYQKKNLTISNGGDCSFSFFEGAWGAKMFKNFSFTYPVNEFKYNKKTHN